MATRRWRFLALLLVGLIISGGTKWPVFALPLYIVLLCNPGNWGRCGHRIGGPVIRCVICSIVPSWRNFERAVVALLTVQLLLLRRQRRRFWAESENTETLCKGSTWDVEPTMSERATTYGTGWLGKTHYFYSNKNAGQHRLSTGLELGFNGLATTTWKVKKISVGKRF